MIEALHLGSHGVEFDRHASFREVLKVRSRGRYVQVHVRNLQGRLRIRGVQIEARAGTRATRAKV